MIKRFHVLYVGQIDLDNVGLDGTPANDRRYPNNRLSEVFFTTRHIAQVMDGLGYHALWTAEHHFQREGYECLPNLMQLGLWLATQTKRLKFGCAFNVLPMWHPIRLAEDYAMADIVTDGRVIMGVGRGYHTREVETFGGPLIDAEKNREYFEEQLQLMLACFNQEGFAFKGKYFTCPPEVEYRGYTLKRHHHGAAAEAPAGGGLDAGRLRQDHRHDGEIRPQGDGDAERREDPRRRGVRVPGRVRAARAAEEAGPGHDLGHRPLSCGSQEEAIRRVEPAHDERYKWFAPFGFVRYADEQGRTWGTPGAPAKIPSLRDGVAQKAWFCGTPGQVIDGIKSIEAKYPGLEDYMIHWAEGLSPSEFEDQLRWFARDVMPAFA